MVPVAPTVNDISFVFALLVLGHTPGNLSAETETCDRELVGIHNVVKSDKKHETDCLPHNWNKR
jgi:hypothetical protein